MTHLSPIGTPSLKNTRPPAFNPEYVSPLPSPSAPPLPLFVNMSPSPSKNPPEDDANLPPVKEQAYKFIEFINNWHKACQKAGLKSEQAYRYFPKKLTSVDAGFSQGFQINDTEKNQSIIKIQEQLNGTKQIASQDIKKMSDDLVAQLMLASIIAAGATPDTNIVLDGSEEIINKLKALLTTNGFNQITNKNSQEKAEGKKTTPESSEAAKLTTQKPSRGSAQEFFKNLPVNEGSGNKEALASSLPSMGKSGD